VAGGVAVRGRVELIERIRARISREGKIVRAFEPFASMLTVNRGLLLPTLRFVRHNGLVVRAGPFADLRYPRSAIAHVPGLATRLAGTYELEISSVVEQLVDAAPGVLVNIGAGDGYYAVGAAHRRPGLRTIAFEADPYQAGICAELISANGVADRVELRGTCTTEALAELGPPPGTPLICDAEGTERYLIDPARVEWLATSPLLIEAHETPVPGIEARLRSVLAPSHRIHRLEHAKRYVEDHPVLRDTPGLSAVEQELLVSEVRHWHTPWLWAEPLRQTARS
jgi:hypothetical protein